MEDVLREKAAAHTFVTPSGMDGALSVQRQVYFRMPADMYVYV